MINTRKPNNFQIVLLVILIFLAAVTSFLLYVNNKKTEKSAAISLEQEQQKWQVKVNTLEKEMPVLTGTSARQSESVTVESETPIATSNQADGKNIVIDPCKETADRIDAFFSRLDKEDYIVDLNLEGGSKAYFAAIS